MKLIKQDLDFIWAQLRLVNNMPLNPLDSTGIRDVQGVGNNILNPFWGSADTPFPRHTYNSLLKSYDPVSGQWTNGYTAEVGGFKGTITNTMYGPALSGLTYDPTYTIDYATRDTTVFDASPRIISNLLSNQHGLTQLQVQDDPSATPGGRLSPLTGNMNPLPYSSYMTLFGQFFDHGLDFVHKGTDGQVFVPLLPGDNLYNAQSPANYMIASRTNTVNVTIGEGSTDDLVTQLGLPAQGTPTWSVVTGALLAGNYTGTLVLNNQIIQVNGATGQELVDAINAATAETGVTASIGVNNKLVLTPKLGESVNTISPFIDLSQSYGSAASHTVFLREYDLNGDVTGRLVSGGASKDANTTPDGMATWADIKANALRIGITLHDYNVEGVPLVRLNADGSTYFDANGQAWLVALNKTTGAIEYVQDTNKAALTANNQVLMTTGHAFLDDMAHGVLAALNENGDVAAPAKQALLEAHFIAGDGRANENIGLTAIHDVFHSEHNRLVEWIKSTFQKSGDAFVLDAQGNYLDADGKAWSNEDVFQAAKFITEMQYQHLVFGEFSRKLSPNINAFAGYDITLDPAITAEFAHAVYRFGHSMLTETVGLTAFGANGIALPDTKVDTTAASLATVSGSSTVTVTLAAHGLSTGNYITLSGIDAAINGLTTAQLNGEFKVKVTGADTLEITVNGTATGTGAGTSDALSVTYNHDLGLIEAFLNPRAYSAKTAGEVALGMSQQVGNAIDEWVTDALRDNLVGLPLDLATLNIVRGRDSGIPSLNEVRLSLFEQTGMTTLKPYASWDEFGANLLHPESLLNFIMAYARDDVLLKFGVGATGATDADKLAYWNDLQLTVHAAYGAALKAAALLAFDNVAFMTGGNKDFWNIDLWLGGLAEKKVAGGMLGSTFDIIFATQMLKLQDGDRFYYLERLLGTNLLLEIEGQLFSDIVMRNTGVAHLYPDIFTVPDSHLEMTAGTPVVKNTFAALVATTTLIADANNVQQKIGTAGFVGDTFYGNPGNYLDARGVFNPNGAGNASEIIGGTANADKINGLGGNDALYGDGGNDTLEGGGGNDFLRGGDGNDVITDQEGDDLIWGDGGNDQINAGMGLDQVFGGEGNDTVYGGLGGDVVDGGAGDDIVYGDNGAGATVSITRDINGKVTGVTVTGVMDPNGDADVIDGGDGDDVLFGGGGADGLNGGEGNDTLIGGGGADVLTGWDGNDVMLMDAGDIGFNHALDGGLGFDIVDYSLSVGNDNRATRGVREGIAIDLSNAGAALIAPGVNVMDTYLSVEGVIGSAYNDTLVGGASVQTDQAGAPIPLRDANGNPVQQIDPVTLLPVVDAFGNPVWVTVPVDFYLDGRAGNDQLVGDAGNDILIGGVGNDTLIGGLGSDTASYAHAATTVTVNLNNQGFQVNGITRITQNTGGGGTDALEGIENVIGGSGGDALTGDGLNNLLAGGAGNDNLVGNAGNDTLIGGAGNDTLAGGAGTDTMSYADATGSVTVTVSQAQSTQTGGAGTDVLSGFENLTGGAFNDFLSGDGAANVVDGGAGNDSISAGAGADTLIGGAGNDTLIGDAGTDVAVFSGRLADYRISFDGFNNEFRVEDLRLGAPDGIDIVRTVENFQFADRTVTATQVIQPLVNFSTPSVVQAEGNVAGAVATTNFVFTVTLSVPYINAVTIPWAVQAGTASAADFVDGVLPSGTLTIAAGQTSGTITVPVLREALKEGDETFSVVLSTPTGGAALGTTHTAAATIVNDDLPTASVSLTTAAQSEGTGPGNGVTYTFTVTLSEALAVGETATVDYAVAGTGAGNLAANAADFLGGVLPSGTITFTGGEAGRTQTVTVTVVGDVLLEANETFSFTISNPGGAAAINIGTASVTATINNDDQRIDGTGGADNLVGNAEANTIYGGDGNDTLDGGVGSDSMVGGTGNDTYVVDNAGDTVVEVANGGTDTVRTSIDYTLNAEVEHLIYTGALAFTGNGNDGANSITGAAGNDTLDGYAGNDTLSGGAGDDVLYGGAGNDVLDGSAGTADVVEYDGALSDYTITLNQDGSITVEDKRGIPLDGVDTLRNVETLRFSASSGTPQTVAVSDLQPAVVTVASVATAAQNEGTALNSGATYTFTLSLSRALTTAQSLTWTVLGTGVSAVSASDFASNTLPTGTVNFAAGETTKTVDVTVLADAQLEANETFTLALSNLSGQITTTGAAASAQATVTNDDTGIVGTAGADTLTGDASANVIDGLDHNDTLSGAAGNDSLVGGAGNDSLDGGLGDDTMVGGLGDDVYVVDSANDVVTEAAAEGTDTVRTSLASYTLGADVEGLIYTGTGAFTGTGNTGVSLPFYPPQISSQLKKPFHDVHNTIVGEQVNVTLTGIRISANRISVSNTSRLGGNKRTRLRCRSDASSLNTCTSVSYNASSRSSTRIPTTIVLFLLCLQYTKC